MENLESARKLTYAELRSMAVAPSEPGAYDGQQVSDRVGLHVHSYDLDNVHVVVDRNKIAEVFPGRTDILYPGGELPAEYRLFANLLPEPWKAAW